MTDLIALAQNSDKVILLVVMIAALRYMQVKNDRHEEKMEKIMDRYDATQKSTDSVISNNTHAFTKCAEALDRCARQHQHESNQ